MAQSCVHQSHSHLCLPIKHVCSVLQTLMVPSVAKGLAKGLSSGSTWKRLAHIVCIITSLVFNIVHGFLCPQKRKHASKRCFHLRKRHATSCCVETTRESCLGQPRANIHWYRCPPSVIGTTLTCRSDRIARILQLH